MTGPVQLDGGAEVVVLRVPAQVIETGAREIGDAFPGWRVWYSDWSDTWNAYREGAKPYFGPVPAGAWVFMVSAYHASDLVAMLEDRFASISRWSSRTGECCGAWAAGVLSVPKSRRASMVWSSSSCTAPASPTCCRRCGRVALVRQTCTVRDSLAGWVFVCLSQQATSGCMRPSPGRFTRPG